MPKLQYPAFFDFMVEGVQIKDDIQHREAYLFVPYKMLFSVSKVQKHKILKPLIDGHSELFSESERQDSKMLTLTLGLMYEITLGKNSYWYPYIR